MTSTLDQRSTTSPATASSSGHELDLCGLDYSASRQQLFSALHALRPGQELGVSARTPDARSLQFEVEARISGHFAWSPDPDTAGTLHATVRRA